MITIIERSNKMGRNSKPASVIMLEKKCHRTKAELERREQAEKDLLSGKGMTEFQSVKKDQYAHKEFLRVKKLMDAVDKNDALYETIINRYCEILSEVASLKSQREFNLKRIEEINELYNQLSDELEVEDKLDRIEKVIKLLTQFQNANNRIDGTISAKRSMLFAIERENIFTISSALRSVPKNVNKQEDDLVKALRG